MNSLKNKLNFLRQESPLRNNQGMSAGRRNFWLTHFTDACLCDCSNNGMSLPLIHVHKACYNIIRFLQSSCGRQYLANILSH